MRGEIKTPRTGRAAQENLFCCKKSVAERSRMRVMASSKRFERLDEEGGRCQNMSGGVSKSVILGERKRFWVVTVRRTPLKTLGFTQKDI